MSNFRRKAVPRISLDNHLYAKRLSKRVNCVVVKVLDGKRYPSSAHLASARRQGPGALPPESKPMHLGHLRKPRLSEPLLKLHLVTRHRSNPQR